jgi:hypothetical protein
MSEEIPMQVQIDDQEEVDFPVNMPEKQFHITVRTGGIMGYT